MTPLGQLEADLKAEIEKAIPGSIVRIVSNGSPCGQNSLLIDHAHAVEVAQFLRDHPILRLDYCSNVTGIDWMDSEISEKVRVKKIVDGQEQEVEETRKLKKPGFLEVVYHLYSMEKKHGPVILRMQTENRTDKVHLPSLTPIWRGAELQEREIFDLFGVIFDGHPDLRRLLMWEGFVDHPMRKDYVSPEDEEAESEETEPVIEGA
jgi:NADH-quinone oxidoreductase subunit C